MATDIQAIKDRLDIVQIIGEYITLKKAGANWKANCPFHHEKSPSFMVHPEKQIWHCFGCGKGGDVLSFVQEMEGLEFVETLKLMGKRAGVEVSFESNGEGASQRTKLLEINKISANFFHQILLKIEQAEPARKYLEQRGLKQDTIIDWQIGFIPDQWELLTKYLVKKGFALNDIVDAGLTIRRENADEATGKGYYDRFRGRIMFPICDTHGNVVGFTGRVLVETENSGGKYVNTPETLLFDKSQVLYGINRAKTEIKAKDLAVLVEGQMDVIACHQAGMTNVVAASGTALTTEQIKLLKRYSNNINMAFDSDSAGQRAGLRGIGVALEQGMNIKVIKIPDGAGKDADECIKKNPTVWFKAVENAAAIMDWYFDLYLSKLDLNDFTAKQKAAFSVLSEIAKIPNGVERDEWLKKLGDRILVEPAVLREEMKRVKIKQPNFEKQTDTVEITPVTRSPIHKLEEEFWSLLLKYPENYGLLREKMPKYRFFSNLTSPLYEVCEKIYNSRNKLSQELLKEEGLEQKLSNYVDLLLLQAERDFESVGKGDAGNELLMLLQRILEKWRLQRGKEIQLELSAAERNKDKEKISELLSELKIIQTI